MNQPGALFELIASMSQSEKRYFRLFSALQSGTKQYEYLFDAVDQALPEPGTAVDYHALEQVVRLKLEEGALVAQNQYPVVKNHLYNHILKALRYSREDQQEPEVRITNWISESINLEKKGLFAQALSRLVKARKLAEKYENLPLLVEILDRMIRLNAQHPPDKKKWFENYMHTQQEKARAVENLRLESVYKQLYFDLLALYKSRTEIKDSKARIKAIFENELLTQSEKAVTFNAQIYLYSLLSFRHLLDGNKERMVFYQKKVIQTWENYDHLIEIDPVRFKVAIYNYLVYNHALQDLKEFETYINRFKKLMKSTSGSIGPNASSEVVSDYERLVQLQYILLLNTGEIDKAMTLTREVEHWLAQPGIEEKMRPGALIWIQFDCFISYFFNEQYHESQVRVDKIHALPKAQGNEVKLTASMLELIILYELNIDERFQSYKTSSAIHQYKRSQHYKAFEKMVLSNLKKLRNPKGNHRKKLLSFEKAFDEFERNSSGQSISGMGEVKIWLKAKVQKKSLKTVSKELAQEQLNPVAEKV
ncbi:MAG: hypothetical protein H6562_20990 [Lewinellaceae bacterium]|nr:hypothetical protein [Lewinella sp.]MCB9281376.1 hypothetical protein [Lewinellaceae bacterium]